MQDKKYVMGLDFGSNSVRALIVEAVTGRECGSAGCVYPGGEQGIYSLPDQPHLARQNPLAYLTAMTEAVREAMRIAAQESDFIPEAMVGIGVDATASTPIPVDERLQPLAADPRFADNLNAYAWMWKDHTAVAEAARITELAQRMHPEYLRQCGGSYSSEWFWSKILHCLKVDRQVFDAAYVWLDFPDFIPATLGGIGLAAAVRPGICAMGHKGLYNDEWGGYPAEEFLSEVDPALSCLRRRLSSRAFESSSVAAHLCQDWSEKLGLPVGIPIAVGIIDAHSGAVGSGIAEGRMVKIIGTSSCDIITASARNKLVDIPGICGQVKGSVLPGSYGIEAGQAAVGDIFNWFVTCICGGDHTLFSRLSQEAAAQQPGRHGLIALDWQNGNRNVLCDQELTGLLLGMTLQTTQADVYRTLVEATAFGARKILDRLSEYGVAVREVVCCGGIAEKDPLLMQIYADVLNRPLMISASSQSCALGAAIFGAVAAGLYPTAEAAQERFCSFREHVYQPDPANVAVYCELYALYNALHDGFGKTDCGFEYGWIMKKLLEIKQRR